MKSIILSIFFLSISTQSFAAESLPLSSAMFEDTLAEIKSKIGVYQLNQSKGLSALTDVNFTLKIYGLVLEARRLYDEDQPGMSRYFPMANSDAFTTLATNAWYLVYYSWWQTVVPATYYNLLFYARASSQASLEQVNEMLRYPSKLVTTSGTIPTGVAGSSVVFSIEVLDQAGTTLEGVQVDWQMSEEFMDIHPLKKNTRGQMTVSQDGLSAKLDTANWPAKYQVIAKAGSHPDLNASFNFKTVYENDRVIVYVKDFSAVGDGVTDDQPAIQEALEFAKALSIERNENVILKFEPKEYLLKSFWRGTVYHLKLVDWGKTYSVDLVGEKSTLVSGQGNASILGAYGNWKNSKIIGMKFKNTYGLSNSTKEAINLNSGGIPHAIENFEIRDNEFLNFSRHISIGGAKNVSVINNRFIMENGRESGGPWEPNVGIWSHNVNGATENVLIKNNFYDGCQNVTQESSWTYYPCGDGLVFGSANPITIDSNVITNFSFEGIYLLPSKNQDSRAVLQQSSSIVSNNTLVGSLLGSRTEKEGYGIRVDLNKTEIMNNYVSNSNFGIMSDSFYYQSADGSPFEVIDLNIHHNVISAYGRNAVGISLAGVSQSTIQYNTVTVEHTNPNLNAMGLFAYGAALGGGNYLKLRDNSIMYNVFTKIGGASNQTYGLGLQYLDESNAIFYNQFQAFDMPVLNHSPWPTQVILKNNSF
jgi:hypothetical protein